MFNDLIANRSNAKLFIKALVLLIIVLLINTIMIRYLWNNSLVKHISIFTPIGGFKDALLLAISIGILKG